MPTSTRPRGKKKAAKARSAPKPQPATKPKAGRPSGYKPEFAAQAKALCTLGATDVELAEFFHVTDRTIYRWQSAHADFCQALKAGKATADDRVERSLYHRAIGFSHEAVKIFLPAGAKKPVYAPFREQVAPDTTACIFWLKNRRPKEWRDRIAHEIGDPQGKPLAPTIIISGRPEPAPAPQAVAGIRNKRD